MSPALKEEEEDQCPCHITPSSLERKLSNLATLTLPSSLASSPLLVCDYHLLIGYHPSASPLTLTPPLSPSAPPLLGHRLSVTVTTEVLCGPELHPLWEPSVTYSNQREHEKAKAAGLETVARPPFDKVEDH